MSNLLPKLITESYKLRALAESTPDGEKLISAVDALIENANANPKGITEREINILKNSQKLFESTAQSDKVLSNLNEIELVGSPKAQGKSYEKDDGMRIQVFADPDKYKAHVGTGESSKVPDMKAVLGKLGVTGDCEVKSNGMMSVKFSPDNVKKLMKLPWVSGVGEYGDKASKDRVMEVVKEALLQEFRSKNENDEVGATGEKDDMKTGKEISYSDDQGHAPKAKMEAKDTDGDGKPDSKDGDDDNDGKPDWLEKKMGKDPKKKDEACKSKKEMDGEEPGDDEEDDEEMMEKRSKKRKKFQEATNVVYKDYLSGRIDETTYLTRLHEIKEMEEETIMPSGIEKVGELHGQLPPSYADQKDTGFDPKPPMDNPDEADRKAGYDPTAFEASDPEMDDEEGDDEEEMDEKKGKKKAKKMKETAANSVGEYGDPEEAENERDKQRGGIDAKAYKESTILKEAAETYGWKTWARKRLQEMRKDKAYTRALSAFNKLEDEQMELMSLQDCQDLLIALNSLNTHVLIECNHYQDEHFRDDVFTPITSVISNRLNESLGYVQRGRKIPVDTLKSIQEAVRQVLFTEPEFSADELLESKKHEHLQRLISKSSR